MPGPRRGGTSHLLSLERPCLQVCHTYLACKAAPSNSDASPESGDSSHEP